MNVEGQKTLPDGKPPSSLKVLLLSADDQVRSDLSSMLSERGFSDQQSLASGLEAMQLLTQSNIGFLVVDQNTKFLPGWLLITELKNSEKIPNLPVILLGTEPTCSVPEEELKQYGVLSYLKMPCKPSDLDFLIRSSLSLFRTSGTAEYKYSKAKEALIKEQSTKAIEMYSELKSFTKNSVRSSFGLVHSFVQNGDIGKAEAEIQNIAALGGQDPSQLFLRFKVALKKNDFWEAEAIASDIIAATADSPYNYMRCANQYLEHGRFDLAANICQAAKDRKFNLPEFDLIQAKCFYGTNRTEEAMRVIDQCREKFGVTKEMLNLKGVCYRKLKKYSDAIGCYEEALAVSPMDARLYFNIAICWMLMNNNESAAQNLEVCLKIAPDFTRAQEKLQEIKKAGRS